MLGEVEAELFKVRGGAFKNEPAPVHAGYHNEYLGQIVSDCLGSTLILTRTNRFLIGHFTHVLCLCLKVAF